jgi:hypothetical protein
VCRVALEPQQYDHKAPATSPRVNGWRLMNIDMSPDELNLVREALWTYYTIAGATVRAELDALIARLDCIAKVGAEHAGARMGNRTILGK